MQTHHPFSRINVHSVDDRLLQRVQLLGGFDSNAGQPGGQGGEVTYYNIGAARLLGVRRQRIWH